MAGPPRAALALTQLLCAATLVATAPWSIWTTPLAPSPPGVTESILRSSTDHFRLSVSSNTNESVDVGELAAGVNALMPVVTVLASFISTPLGKDAQNLAAAADLAVDGGLCARPPCRSVDLDTLQANERQIAADYRGHRPIAASAYWSMLFLDFFERILEGVLERHDRTLAAPAKEYDALADAALRESAREAYSHSYAPHHNRVVRAIARKVFDFLPSREVFYRALGDAGADRKRWDRDLKRDMEQCLSALRPTVRRLKRHFAEGAPQGA